MNSLNRELTVCIDGAEISQGCRVHLQNILLIIGVLLLAANTVSILNKGRKDWQELSGQARHRTLEDTQNSRLKSLEDWRLTVDRRLNQADARVDEANKDTTEMNCFYPLPFRHLSAYQSMKAGIQTTALQRKGE